MRISDWSSDVCSSDLAVPVASRDRNTDYVLRIVPVSHPMQSRLRRDKRHACAKHAEVTSGHLVRVAVAVTLPAFLRSEEHTSELQSLMRISYAVFCLKKKTTQVKSTTNKPPKE